MARLECSKFSNKDFLDSDHLNSLGAKKFTELLISKIDSISCPN
jgi:hypothetical protein